MKSAHCTHTITVSDDGSHVILRIVGEMTTEKALELTLASHAHGKEHGLNRYLVDVTQCRNVGSISDNYSLAYEGARDTPGVDLTARVAVLTDPDDRSHDFAGTVSRNAGTNLTLFTSLDSALRYLLGA